MTKEEIETIIDSAKIGAVVLVEINKQLAEVVKNTRKMFKQNEDCLALCDAGIVIMMTAAGRTPIRYVIGTDKAVELMLGKECLEKNKGDNIEEDEDD